MYKFKLFIAGFILNTSKHAINDIQTILNTYLKDTYSLDIIDVIEKPAYARGMGVFLTPTLIMFNGEGKAVERVLGSFSNHEKVLRSLGMSIDK